MWKVKRMNTARIVVLTIAVGAGGIAAYPASGSDNRPAPTEPVPQLQTADVLVGKTVTPELPPEQSETLAHARQTGTLSLALRSISDLNAIETDDQPRLSDGVNGIRYGVSIPTTVQK
jgi:Flp pilus assembly protein CpaB